jgi:Na+/H+-dicarboxylate symporter
MQLIDDNMAGIFVNSNFLGVIVLGAGFGVALTQLTNKKPEGVNWDRIITIQLLEELLQVFMMFVVWIIKVTPFAIISLIASAIGSTSDLSEALAQVGYLLGAIFVGLMLQFFVVYCGMYILFIRRSPIAYFKNAIPAFTMAFACASSAATLPVSMDCAIRFGIPEGLARFILPLGATVNMDGTSIQIICSCVWLAYQNGIVPGTADYILLAVCATMGSMGAAPSASIVLIITTYSTVFGATEGSYPNGLAYIIAVE